MRVLLILCAAALAACQTTPSGQPESTFALSTRSQADVEADEDVVIIPLTATATISRVRTDREKSAAYYNRGYLHFQQRSYPLAEKDFNAAIDHKLKQSYKAYYARGLCKQNTGRLREAAADFAIVYELRPDWSYAQRKKREFWWAYGDPNPYEKPKAGATG